MLLSEVKQVDSVLRSSVRRNREIIIIGSGFAGLFLANSIVRMDPSYKITLIGNFEQYSKNFYHYHLQILVGGGLKLVNKMIPDFSDKLIASGGHTMDWKNPNDALWFWQKDNHGGQRHNSYSSVNLISCSKTLIMKTLKDSLPDNQVQFVNTTVAGLLVKDLNNGEKSICGVKLSEKIDWKNEKGIDFIKADCVISTSGKGSSVIQWLDKIGYKLPAPLEIDAGVFYSSFTFELPRIKKTWKFLYSQQEGDSRTVIAYINERSELVIALTGIEGKNKHITEVKELIDELENIRGTQPLIDLIRKSYKTNVLNLPKTVTSWKLLSMANKLPQGFVIIGDAMCSTNQMHGQGMTNAAFQINEFVELLKYKQLGSLDFIKTFYKRADKHLLMSVLLSSFTDIRKSTLKTCKIPSLFLKIAIPLFGLFMDGFNNLTVKDPKASNLFILIANREISPWSSLVKHPIMLLKIIFESIKIVFKNPKKTRLNVRVNS